MVFLLYNKILLRVLVAITGLAIAVCIWKYVSLSIGKLGAAGARDALAIVSFLVAGWLVMLIAEVIDHHYMRALGCLAALAGGVISFRWIFLIDGPELQKPPNDQGDMLLVGVAFSLALGAALLMFGLLVARLVLDRLTFGRKPVSAMEAQQKLSTAQVEAATAANEQHSQAEGLAPIPVDVSPLAVSSEGEATAPVTRTPAAVSKLVGIGGMHQGTDYLLTPGEHSIGRQDCDLSLAGDKQVSRSHAKLVVSAEQMTTLLDNGSTNGTFVNNLQVETCELAPGDVIRVGTNQFRVEA